MSVADEAAAAVEERMRSYGHPSVNHACTAELWRAYLRRRHGVDVALDAQDVCLLNALQKVSREANERRRDNLVDLIGYVMNVDLIQRDVIDGRGADAPWSGSC